MEELMQYVWLHRLWPPGKMFANDGRPVSVIDVGRQNRDAGPDFFNAKVRIGDETWCGNVEFHVRASDWHRHGHDSDPAYDSVILHVVQFDDCAITTRGGRRLPQMVLECARDFSQRYAAFVGNQANTLACASEIKALGPVAVRDWLDSLAYERLYAKVEAIRARLERTAGNWEQTAFVTLGRALGAGINGDAFERVAASLPLRLMHKHSDSLLSLEALLLGQAGLIDPRARDPYVERLGREYEFLASKFGLKPPEAIVWRMSRMRPASFPHRRLAALAAMVCGGFRLMQRVADVENEEQARALFRFELTGYWANHCNLSGALLSGGAAAFGSSTVDMLVVNVVAPLMMAWSDFTGDDLLAERAVDILEHLPPENNRFTRDFTAAGVACPDAFVSQAMVQAHTAYCDVRKCLYCRVGHRLLAARVTP